MVQTASGALYLKCHGVRRRAYAWSDDGGLSFVRAGYDEGLLEPICHASVLLFTDVVTHDHGSPAAATPSRNAVAD